VHSGNLRRIVVNFLTLAVENPLNFSGSQIILPWANWGTFVSVWRQFGHYSYTKLQHFDDAVLAEPKKKTIVNSSMFIFFCHFAEFFLFN
jgi:hypothetical protein